MPNKITVILLYDTKAKLSRSLEELINNPNIVKLKEDFDVKKLEGHHGALLLWPNEHYVSGCERFQAVKRFQVHNTVLNIELCS